MEMGWRQNKFSLSYFFPEDFHVGMLPLVDDILEFCVKSTAMSVPAFNTSLVQWPIERKVDDEETSIYLLIVGMNI